MKAISVQSRILFTAVYLLTGLGVVMTYSASAVMADHAGYGSEHYLIRQVFYVFLGTLLLFASASVPVEFWKRHSRALVFLAIGFLVMVYMPVIGRSGGGAQRWIRLGPLNFQPAEFAKIAVCVYLSDYLSRKMKVISKGSIGIFLPPIFLIGLICALTLAQPDLGSTAFIFLLACLLFFLAGIRLRYVLGSLFLILPALVYLVVKEPYRLSRVTAYLNPWEDPQGSGFQIIQALLSFGIGGVHGQGLGQGIQKLFYLPSGHNDFIFSIIAEELGLVGALGIVFLYAVIFFCGIQLAEKAEQDYEKMLITSLTLMIVLQAIIHMLVTTGLVPTKGLPLPFVSFGGTSMLFNMMAVGLLLGADRHLQARGR